MASSFLARSALTGTAVLSLLVTFAACDDRYYGRYDRDCDYTYRQCQTVCDYWCDYWSCYPTCWDRCWNECGIDPRRPSAPPASSTSSSTSTSTSGAPAPAPDDAGAIDPGPGTGVLCTPCDANSDCEEGAVCILRGGAPRDSEPDASAPIGRGFCGHACTTSNDCPDGFLCSQLGSSRQCLPTAGRCGD